MSAEHVCLSENVLLHIGYHKTASTWFQAELFAHSEYGFQLYRQPRNVVHSTFCNPDPFSAPSANDISRLIREANEATDSGKCYVISHERLSGYPSSGGYDSALIATRLKKHFPNARIFCLFREQQSMILSMWRQQVVDGGGASLKNYLQPPEPKIHRIPTFKLSMYTYSKLFKHYIKLFEKENVLFLPFEEFCSDPEAVIRKLGTLVGGSDLLQNARSICSNKRQPNPSLAIPILHLQRLLNMLLARTQMSPNCIVNVGSNNIRGVMRLLHTSCGVVFSPIDKMQQKTARRIIQEHCQNYYDEDNAVLSDLIGQPLSMCGYSVASRVEKKDTDEY